MAGRPWNETPCCAIDVEATGLKPGTDELLSFAAVPIDDGRIRVGRAVYHLVRPSRMPDERTIVVHGIRPLDVAGAPPVEDVLDDLIDALDGRPMVAHAAWVEHGFLAPLFRRRGRALPKVVVDTNDLGRLWLASRGQRERRRTIELDELARMLGLPAHRRHHALGDALTTAQVFLALATHLSAERPQTVEQLARAGAQLRRARYDWSVRP